MEFTITYRGPLPSNGNAKQKHLIRAYLRPQLDELWQLDPLKSMRQLLKEARGGPIKEVSGFKFLPVISSKWDRTAELDVLFLRYGPPGKLLVAGGDLDNRLKTLFDALSIPTADQIGQVPPAASREEEIACLLEDDSLIHRFSVDADRLLAPHMAHSSLQPIAANHPETEVLLIIRVKVIEQETSTLGLE